MLKPALVCSLFPNVPPTIYFSTRDERGELGRVARPCSSIPDLPQPSGLLFHASSGSGLHPLPADLQPNIRIALDTAAENRGIVFGFLLSSTFCLPSGKAALGAEEAAAVENVHGHAEHREANHRQVSLQSQQK